LQSFQIKPENEKKEKEKKKRPRGQISARNQRTAHGPLTFLPESVPSPFSFFTDKWDPHVSTDVVVNLRPKISPEDAVIFSY
jgi:hypothetical protein